jgi:hypothetical protein
MTFLGGQGWYFEKLLYGLHGLLSYKNVRIPIEKIIWGPPLPYLIMISTNVDGRPSGGCSVRRPGSEDPHWHEQKL